MILKRTVLAKWEHDCLMTVTLLLSKEINWEKLVHPTLSELFNKGRPTSRVIAGKLDSREIMKCVCWWE